MSDSPVTQRAKPLDGKVAILHVGAPGWAAPLTRALQCAGAKVALAAGSHEVATLGADTGADLFLGGPLNDKHAISSAVSRVEERFGRLDILVNAPQAELFRPISELSDSDLLNLFDRNAASAFRWCQGAGAHLSRQPSGRIINFISGLARRGLSNASAYSMTQAALDAMTQSLALEWAGTGIRVNGIGYGWTEATHRPLEAQQKDRLVRYLPLRRKGHPDDLSGLLVYLASDASSFITGQTVFVDGGALAHA
ncbi:MAG: SDR family oxidoreductase [Dehalococcoidia bacterium]|nr:SDR family oxidoreductase [Dehalococcoidia bacterium]MSQ35135.1 SDR family oxidoreductase [Dehalococcoidia bacterium]